MKLVWVYMCSGLKLHCTRHWIYIWTQHSKCVRSFSIYSCTLYAPFSISSAASASLPSQLRSHTRVLTITLFDTLMMMMMLEKHFSGCFSRYINADFFFFFFFRSLNVPLTLSHNWVDCPQTIIWFFFKYPLVIRSF